MKILKKKRPSEIILEVPRQTIGLFPEFLNALSVMSIFILAVIFYRGIQNHQKRVRIIPAAKPKVAKVVPAPAPKVIEPEIIQPKVEKIVTEAPKPVETPQPVVKKETKDITSVKSVFRFKYRNQDAVSIENFNFFRPSSFKLTRGGKKRLRKLAPFLKSHNIIVHGHTDPVPAKFVPAREWNTNEELAKFRAKAIKKYLKRQGLSGEKIEIGEGRKIHPKKPEGSRGATFILN